MNDIPHLLVEHGIDALSCHALLPAPLPPLRPIPSPTAPHSLPHCTQFPPPLRPIPSPTAPHSLPHCTPFSRQVSVKDIPRLPVEQVQQIREQVEGEVKMLADSLASLCPAFPPPPSHVPLGRVVPPSALPRPAHRYQ
ncbi:unnamed protein product [Closterium sp. NIES-54]